MITASRMYLQFLQDVKTATGLTAEEWKARLRQNGLTRHSDRLQWLQAAHALPYREAYLLASHADETRPNYSDEAGLVDAMYRGGNAHLRPAHDALTELAILLGPDVTASVAKTMVTFRRKHVFAQIKPATKTRIDFGLALPRLDEPPARLIATGGLEKGDRITYRIAVSVEADIDRELEAWLRRAYAATDTFVHRR